MNQEEVSDFEEVLIRENYEQRIGRKLTDEEVSAFKLTDELKHEAERDFDVDVHFHKGKVSIGCYGQTVFVYDDFDDSMNNEVTDAYHLADIVYRALRLERVGLCEIRDSILNQKGTTK